MKTDTLIAGIGETLMDVFPDGTATVGGAPFNVAFHLHQLLSTLHLGQAVMVTAVGNDRWGEYIRASIAGASMSLDYLSVNTHHPTGTASVFEYQGAAGFEIQQNVAWDYLEETHTTKSLAYQCNAVAFGSLAQRSDTSRHMIQKFVENVNGHRLYDVNLRRNTNTGITGYSYEVIDQSCRIASIVKLNDVELEEVGKILGLSVKESDVEKRTWILMELLMKKYSPFAVAVTRGARGALCLGCGRRFTLPDSRLNQDHIHPVGGGDAFSAGLLFGITQGWTLDSSLGLANIMSNSVVQHVSATPQLSDDTYRKIVQYALQASFVGSADSETVKGFAQIPKKDN